VADAPRDTRPANTAGTNPASDGSRSAPPTRLSRRLYLFLTAGLWIASLIVALEGNRLLAIALQAVAGVFVLMFVYWMWTVVPVPFRRTTPWEAVLYLFVPLVGLYWLFQVFWGYAIDFNRYADRIEGSASKTIRRLRPALGILFCVSFLVFLWGQVVRVFSPTLELFANLVWLTALVLYETAVCHSVNSLADFNARGRA